MVPFPLFDPQNMPFNPWDLATRLVMQWAKAGSWPLFASAGDFDSNKSGFGLENVKFRGTSLQIKERVILEHPFVHLLHFNRTTEDATIQERLKKDPKVLMVTPMAGHFSTLMRDTVEAMLPSHDVYITDWIDAKLVPLSDGYFDVEDQIEFLMDVIEKLGPDLHIIGISHGAVTTLCATALLAQKNSDRPPITLTLLGGPINAHAHMSSFSQWAISHALSWYRSEQIQMVPFYYAGAMRRVYPGSMQLMDRMAMAQNNALTEQEHYFAHLVHGDEDSDEAHDKLYGEFISVMDVTEEYHLQFVERVYQRNDLAKGSFTFRGTPIDLSAIKETALLTVEADLDDLCPSGTTRAALDLCPNIPATKKKAHLEISIGHYGTFNGRIWRNNIQPAVHAFIREHSAPMAA